MTNTARQRGMCDTPASMLETNTHPAIDPDLVGVPTHLAPGEAVVTLELTGHMAADYRGLVHGGFVFGLADYAAMLAVNDPNVVLGASTVRFLRPARVGDRIEAHARVEAEAGKKRQVVVAVRRDDDVIMEGELTCFVLDVHVLDRP